MLRILIATISFITVLSWALPALAVDLTGFDVADDAKKLVITFNFENAEQAEVIHHYAGNFIAIKMPDLQVSRTYSRKPHKPDSEETAQFYSHTSFEKIEGEWQIRIYLGKYASPADAQVVKYEDRAVVELVKPFYKLPKVEDQPPVETEQPIEPTGTDTETPVETDQPNEEVSNDFPDSLYMPTEVETEVDDLINESQPSNDITEPIETERPERTTSPSYKNFDLNDVTISDIELKNIPFNEALMELVAGSGFNVIVGKGVSDEKMTLSFRQKELSLKRALDMLCTAYSLTYIVEDDAIIVRGQ